MDLHFHKFRFFFFDIWCLAFRIPFLWSEYADALSSLSLFCNFKPKSCFFLQQTVHLKNILLFSYYRSEQEQYKLGLQECVTFCFSFQII